MLQHKVVSGGCNNVRFNQTILLSPKTLELLSKIDLIKWSSRFFKKNNRPGTESQRFFTEMAKTFHESCLRCQASRATITGRLLPQLKEQGEAAGCPGGLCLDGIMLWISSYRLAVIDEPTATAEQNKCTALRSLGEAHRMLRIDSEVTSDTKLQTAAHKPMLLRNIGIHAIRRQTWSYWLLDAKS